MTPKNLLMMIEFGASPSAAAADIAGELAGRGLKGLHTVVEVAACAIQARRVVVVVACAVRARRMVVACGIQARRKGELLVPARSKLGAIMISVFSLKNLRAFDASPTGAKVLPCR